MIYTRRQFVDDACNEEVSLEQILYKRRNRPPHHDDLEQALLAISEEMKNFPQARDIALEFLEREMTGQEQQVFVYRFGAKMKIDEIASRLGVKFSDVVVLITQPLNRLKKVWRKELGVG